MGDKWSPRRIVVGVDGSRAARAAVLWAATEARLRDCALIVTHIDPGGTNIGALDRATGRCAILDTSGAAASRHEPAVVVGTHLLGGSIRDQLVQVSASAKLLVLGVEKIKARAAHGALGPIEDRVAVHARCRVVVVGDTAPSSVAVHANVLTCWTNSSISPQVLEAAAEEAELRSATLTIAYLPDPTRPDPTNPDPTSPDPTSVTAGPRRTEPALQEAVAELSRAHPQLPVAVCHPIGEAAPALTLLAHRADLVVVGSHHSEDAWSIRTGPVVRDLMRNAPCPVMLVGREARTATKVPGREGPWP